MRRNFIERNHRRIWNVCSSAFCRNRNADWVSTGGRVSENGNLGLFGAALLRRKKIR